MARIFSVFFRSWLDLFHWRIFFLFLIPPVAALCFWGGLAYLTWGQFLLFTQSFGERFLSLREIPIWLQDWFSVTPDGLTQFLAAFVAVVLLIPLTFVTSMILTSVLAMPVVIRILSVQFPHVEKRGQVSMPFTVRNWIGSIFIYLILWIVTLPLWALPGLSFAIPLLLNTFLNYRLFLFDALSEHASPVEIQKLRASKRVDFLLLSMLISSLVLFPPFFFILPVYSAFCFARFSLLELNDFRRAS